MHPQKEPGDNIPYRQEKVTIQEATYTIAPNDSYHSERADDKFSGTDDQTKLQAVIDDIVKGKIVILDGNVSLNPNVVSDYHASWYTAIKMRSNITIGGAGFTTVLKLVDNLPDSTMMFEVNTKEYVKIVDLKIDANDRNAVNPPNSKCAIFFKGSTYVEMKRLHIHDSRSAIYGDGSGGVFDTEIIGNLFTRDPSHSMNGIDLHNFGANSIIAHNTVGDVNGMSIGISPNESTRAIISDNFIRVAGGGFGIRFYDEFNDSICSNNKIYGVGSGYGIYLYGGATRLTHRNKIIENHIENVATGIAIDADHSDNEVFGNTFINCTTPLIDNGLRTQIPEISLPYPIPDGNIGTHPALVLTDGIDITGRFEITLPRKVAQIVTAHLIIVPGGTGNMRRSLATNFGTVGSQDYNAHTDSIAAGEIAVTQNKLEMIDIKDALTDLSAIDTVGIEFTRVGSHGDDTVNADCYLLGLKLRYV